MSYCSQIALKTTTEGWIILKTLNDKIKGDENKPLFKMTVEKTPTGYYKISNSEIRWYEEYANVKNFKLAMDKMREQDIPFVFIDIGEDYGDITIQNNWTSDMPDAIETFDVETNIIDEDEGCYETIMIDGIDPKPEGGDK